MTKICVACGAPFPGRLVIDGKTRYLYGRRFCLVCSPFGIHNTSKTPPRLTPGPELIEYRRRRRNAKTHRWQKRHRSERKLATVAARGGRCADCGYAICLSALEFHHRDSSQKEFGLGEFTGSLARYLQEAEKCDLVCANCHRIRHALEDRSIEAIGVIARRREVKARAVAHMGGACAGCGWRGESAVFEFHHRDGSGKEFGVGQDGVVRAWAKMLAELQKCVMLCANCHREVHAGVRKLDDGHPGLAEERLEYVA